MTILTDNGLSEENRALIVQKIGDDNWRRGDFLWFEIINDLLDEARAQGSDLANTKGERG